jgi:hypothetical protein
VLRLLDKEGELRVLMGLAADGTPVLQFVKDNEPTWAADGAVSVPETEAVEDPEATVGTETQT